MSLAKTKKKKRRNKLFASAKPKVRKNYQQLYSDKHLENFSKLISFDEKLHLDLAEGTLIIGFDEVGRGCVAGPVCTGAYSCSSFYAEKQDLLTEVKRSSQLMSGDFISLNDRDRYYAETIINETSIRHPAKPRFASDVDTKEVGTVRRTSSASKDKGNFRKRSIEADLQDVQEISSLLLLDDSKKVLKSKRKALCKALLDLPYFSADQHLFHSTNMQSAEYIDKYGIVKAIWRSMTENLINIVQQHLDLYHRYPDEILLLIDGTKTIQNLAELSREIFKKRKIIDFSFLELGLDYKQTHIQLKREQNEIIIRQKNIVKGDSTSSLIAAASNLAKDKRDDYMRELAISQPQYIWETNVGYGTSKHMRAIQEHGLTKEHRKTFLGNINAGS
ncbi:MAG: hypothetical protein O3C63_00870 [Cyanobacteria bacterium]|nr:hypothetical protein [Cyanobacteriota bacterium]MDA1021479.1 hypothetical protein [Cyanobacteriota bacterium]